ncbi:CoA-dependent acyltransferase [Marasmius fiardii PR-910]|nr:CoA-dependent acyltransferase [Marasmius fiardii PR-910]
MLSSRLTARLLGRSSRRYLFVAHYHATNSAWAARKITQKFKLADIGEGITECEVIKWSVKPNSTVQAFDPLCEVQSDKASVEITSPFDGVVTEILVQEGEVAKVGSGLCLIEVDEESAASVDSSAVESVVESETAGQSSTKKQQSTPRQEAVEHPPERSPESPRRKHPMDPTYSPEVDGSGPRAENVLATPSVRHYARQKGVDLAKIAPGSGKDRRIEKRDVEAYLSGATTTTSTLSPSPSPSPPETRQVGEDVVVELGRTRYGMWKAMEKSLEIPHFGYSTTLDLTMLDRLLPSLNSFIPPHFLPPPTTLPPPQSVSPASLYPPPSPPPVPSSGHYTNLTYLPFLLKTLSNAMMEWPLLRSSITPTSGSTSSKPTLTIRPRADISIALSTPSGLYTPTLQGVNTHSVYGIASQLKHLSHLGRQTPCGLTVKEMPKRGGTVTVSNVGAIGAGDSASPVLVPGGGVAIVAIGRAKWVWDVDRGDGKGERRLKVGVSWSADHRVVEGAELAAFVECWRTYVEVPERMIGSSV